MSLALENRLHTPIWWDAVRESRQRLGLSPIPEEELEQWLTRCPGLPLLSECQQVFQKLELCGLPRRYLPYFTSCVLTHHRASLRPHGAPQGLIPPMLDSDLDVEGYYLVFYRPTPGSHPRPEWEVVTPLCGFAVLWPNMAYAALGDGLDRICDQEKLRGESLTWLLRPVTGADMSSETTERGVAPVPLLNFPNYVGIVGLRGSGMIAYREPRIQEGLFADPAEQDLVQRWHRFLRRWAVLYAPAFLYLSFPPGRA